MSSSCPVSRTWCPCSTPNGSRSENRAAGYVVHRYRPRIEGLFARIERWTRISDGDAHWRSLLPGQRADRLRRRRAVTHRRPAGRQPRLQLADLRDAATTRATPSSTTTSPRTAPASSFVPRTSATAVRETIAAARANRYLKRIRYGNRGPLLDPDGNRPTFLDETRPGAARMAVRGRLRLRRARPRRPAAGRRRRRGRAGRTPSPAYRAGFEIRTSRLCRRVLMFHHFADEPGVGERLPGAVHRLRLFR